MTLYIASLNSGSNGNCYYVGNEEEAVLIDAGLSCRETFKRMKFAGEDPHTLAAILITHEHSDHVYGLATLAKKLRIPVFMTGATHSAWARAICGGYSCDISARRRSQWPKPGACTLPKS